MHRRLISDAVCECRGYLIIFQNNIYCVGTCYRIWKCKMVTSKWPFVICYVFACSCCILFASNRNNLYSSSPLLRFSDPSSVSWKCHKFVLNHVSDNYSADSQGDINASYRGRGARLSNRHSGAGVRRDLVESYLLWKLFVLVRSLIFQYIVHPRADKNA